MQQKQLSYETISSIKNMRCVKCNNDRFVQQFFLKTIPKFLIAAPTDILQPFQVFVCSNPVCNHPQQTITEPKEIKE